MPDDDKEATEGRPLELHRAVHLLNQVLATIDPLGNGGALAKGLGADALPRRASKESSALHAAAALSEPSSAVVHLDGSTAPPLSPASQTAAAGWGAGALGPGLSSAAAAGLGLIGGGGGAGAALGALVPTLAESADGASASLGGALYRHFKHCFGVHELAQHKLVGLLDAICHAQEVPPVLAKPCLVCPAWLTSARLALSVSCLP